MPGASNSKSVYASASSKYAYTLSVSWSESATSSYNNTSVISASGSFGSSTIGFSAGSSYNYYLRLYWHDNRTNSDTLIATSSVFRSAGRNYGTRTVSGSITVTHKSDGTLNGYVRCEFYNQSGSTSGGYAPTTTSVQTSSQSLTDLGGGGGSDPDPGGGGQKSDATLSGSTTLGEEVIVNIQSYGENYTHTVSYNFAGSAYTTVATHTVSDRVRFTPPASLVSQIPNASSGVMTVRVRTYDEYGDSLGYTYLYRTMYAPATSKPTIGNFTATRVDNDIPSDWGIYVQGHSQCTLTLDSSSGNDGATITGCRISGNGIEITSNTSTISGTTEVLNIAGFNTFTVTVTDSRGQTATKQLSIDVVGVGAPPFISIVAERCDADGSMNPSGTYASVTVDYTIASINGKNSVKSMIATCNNVSNTNFMSGVPFILAANMSVGSSYTVSATVTDALDRSWTTTVNISSDSRIMNIKKNKRGVAFGKFSETDDTFDVRWNSIFRGNINSEGKISASDGFGVTYNDFEDDFNYPRMEGNTLLSARFFDYVNSETYLPSRQGQALEIVGQEYQTQLAISNGTSPGLYIRTMPNGGSWTNWTKLADAADLANKANANHTHDDRYYTESEVDTKINAKADSTHHHYYACHVGGQYLTTDWIGFYGSTSSHTTRDGWIGYGSGANAIRVANERNNYLDLYTSDGKALTAGYDEGIYPGRNGRVACGHASYKWNRVYATSGTINTSDKRLKRDIEDISDPYVELFKKLRPISYKRTEGVRTHLGFISQEVKESMDSIGLTDNDFAGWCADVVQEQGEDSKWNTKLDENGEPEMVYSLCYTEFIALNTKMIQKLMQTVEDQQKQINELKTEIETLKNK